MPCYRWPALNCDGPHPCEGCGPNKGSNFYNGNSPHTNLGFTPDSLDISIETPGIMGESGTNIHLRPGALLAIPPTLSASIAANLSSSLAKRLLVALTDYGGYLDDNTASNSGAFTIEGGVLKEVAAAYGGLELSVEPSGPAPETAFYLDMVRIFRGLHIVDNNSPERVGGGGTSRKPTAPPICGATEPPATKTDDSAVVSVSHPMPTAQTLPTIPSLVFTSGFMGVPCFRIPDATATNVRGEILAFAGANCAAREDGCQGVGPRAQNMTHGYVAMRRSTDFGNTWGALAEVPGTVVPCDVRTHADVIYDSVRNVTVVLSQHQRKPCCRLPYAEAKPVITMTKSFDGGRTWSASVSPLPGLELNAYVQPGKGLQVARGQKAGRLIAVAQTGNTSWTGPGGPNRTNDCCHLCTCDVVFVSDDGGDSWQRSTPTIERNDEATLTELKDGSLLMSLRGAYNGPPVNMSPLRRQVRSTDGGSTWQPIGVLVHDFGNASCFGSLARAGDTLLFSHPFAHGAATSCWKNGPSQGWPSLARCNGTLFTSRDEAKTWQPWVQATDGNSSQLFAYSDLIVLSQSVPPSLGLFFETGSVNGYGEGPACSLMFKRFALPVSPPMPTAQTLQTDDVAPLKLDDEAIIRVELGAAGLRFDGHGGVSGGGGSSRLLIDYPEPQRSQILDLMFLPKLGAAMTQLKLEIGADSQTTQGVEPSHMHTRSDNSPTAFNRGWNWWLATEAKWRNPDLTLTGAQWGAPGWVAGKEFSSLGNLTNAANVEYVTRWVAGAKREHNLTIDFVSVSKNEYPDVAPGTAEYVLALRRSLDAAGLQPTGLLAGDQDQRWILPEFLLANATTAAVIDVLSCHVCRIGSDSGPTPAVLRSKKKIWTTEEHFNGATSESAWANAARLAKHINNNYLTMSMTATIVWTVAYSWYPGVDLGNGHLVGLGVIDAHQPWSGWYNVSSPALWVMGHTNQFATPGWRFLPPGKGSGFLPGDPGGSVRSVGCEVCPAAKETAPRMLWLQYPKVAGGQPGWIQAGSDGQCLRAASCTTTAGIAAVTADCSHECTAASSWTVTGDNVRLNSTDLCLTASVEIPRKLTLETCSNTHGQRWRGSCDTGLSLQSAMATPDHQCLVELVGKEPSSRRLQPVRCPANQSGVTCGGTKHDGDGDGSAEQCGAACCADPSCQEWHWKKALVLGTGAAAGGCWRGACAVTPSPAAGWFGGTRHASRSPSSPAKPDCCLAQHEPYRRRLDSPPPEDFGGSYVTLVSPDGYDDYSIVIETMDATVATTHRFQVSATADMSGLPTKLHVWQTTEHANFRQLTDVDVGTDGSFTLKLEPHAVITVTTTTGQHAAPSPAAAASMVPPPLPFPCEHVEDFDKLPPDSLAPLLADQTGTFAVTSESTGGQQVYTQQVPIPTDNIGQNSPHPIAIIGDSSWSDVSVTAMVRLAAGVFSGDMVAIGGRVAGGPTSPSQLWSNGVFLEITATNWTVSGGKSTATGNHTVAPGEWVRLGLNFSGDVVRASIGDKLVATVQARFTQGYVTIGCSYGGHSFDNVSIQSHDARCKTDGSVAEAGLKQPGGFDQPVAIQLKTDDTAAAFDSYPVLWDSNSIEPAALVAVGIRPSKHLAVAPNTIRDWPCQDSPKDYCRGEAFGSYCLRGQWPIINAKGELNGGVPHNANLSAHLAQIRRTMPVGVAENYTGIIGIDFESWSPIWSEDTSKDGSKTYQNLSISLVLQAQPQLPLAQAKTKAKNAFETAALEFFVETIKLCRALRPRARWGYYGYPQPFVFDGYDTANGPTLRALNDQLQPLWDASDVLLPSIYLAQWHASAATLAKMNAAQINTTMRESVRLQKQTKHRPDIWPFMYSYYNSNRQNVTLTAEDTVASIAFPYALGATGLVVWGDPSYNKNWTVPGTVAQFQKYFHAVLGPTIAGVKKTAQECANARCHGHGRCIGEAAGSGCNCERGFSPVSNCSLPAGHDSSQTDSVMFKRLTLPVISDDGGAKPSVCPSDEDLEFACHNARSVSVGECLVCMMDKFSPRCTDTDKDTFCNPGSAGSSNIPVASGVDSSGQLSQLAGVLGSASPGDILVRGATSWQTPSHRTIINAVDEFQVDSTGATNSTDRLQLAVDAAAALPNGGAVYLSAGNYQVENIHVASNVDLYGDSRSRTFCHTPGSSKPMFTVENSMNVRIRDMWLVGGGGPAGPQTAVQTAGALLNVNNAQKCQFTNLQLTNMHVGIKLSHSTNCEISFVNAYNCCKCTSNLDHNLIFRDISDSCLCIRRPRSTAGHRIGFQRPWYW